MRDYNLTPEARDDLLHIHDFIARDNPHAAARVIDECFDIFGNLAEHPFMGHKRADLTARNVYFWSFYSYLIIYEAHTKPITIVRVLSGFRDIVSML